MTIAGEHLAAARSWWRGAAVAILALPVAAMVLLPALAHLRLLTVRTGSMAPALPTGSLVVARRVDPAQLRVGDIATYQQASGALVTHRVVAIDETATPPVFTFRGDANAAADPEQVKASAIRARVWFSVPLLGTVRARLAAARPVLTGVAVLALGGYALGQVAIVVRERRSRS